MDLLWNSIFSNLSNFWWRVWEITIAYENIKLYKPIIIAGHTAVVNRYFPTSNKNFHAESPQISHFDLFL